MLLETLGPREARILGNILRGQRTTRQFSLRELARRSQCNIGTISKLENGKTLSPHLDSLRNLCWALGLPLADLFTAIGWLPPDELPELQPYLRSKYRDLSDADIAAIQAYTDQRRQRHGGTAPTHREDETTDG